MNLKSIIFGKSGDEYIEQRKVQFKVEGLYIILILLSLNVLQGIIRKDLSDHVIISMGIIVFYNIYYLLRKTFSGIEYPDIATENRYRKKRKEVIALWFTSFIVFIVVNIGDKLFFHPDRSWIDILGISLLFLIILFAIEYFSLKRSYTKNKSITENSDDL